MENKYYTVKEVQTAKAQRYIQHKIQTSDLFKKKFIDLLLFGQCSYSDKEIRECLKN